MAALMESKGDVTLTTAGCEIDDTTDLGRLLAANSMPGAQGGHALTVHSDGVTGYESLLALINSATISIDYATYVLGHDSVGEKVVTMLAEKAASGVRVRLLLDGVGCVKIGRRFLAGKSPILCPSFIIRSEAGRICGTIEK